MSYTVLYRKLRPQKFGDVLGQPHIIKTITNQLGRGRVAHAYLFCGTRGCGKTSTAKILARAVNCENPDADGSPCNSCGTCVSIQNNSSMNVSEINAADYTGVENIRGIIEEVMYPPASGKYRVYIIDEVHMLTNSAFNALLTTLEEPPAHVIFILATTDPQKIPATVHSRCQRFDFRRIPPEIMYESMRGYITSENIQADDDALKYIVSVSDGAMRDAQSILEQCVSFYYGEEITLEKTLELLGAVDTSVFFELTEAIFRSDAKSCVSLIDSQVGNGRDVNQFIRGMVNHIRNVLVCKSSGGKTDMYLIQANRYAAQGEKIDTSLLIYYIDTFNELLGNLRYTANEKTAFEVACIKLCYPPAPTDSNVLARLAKLESQGFQAPQTQKPPVVQKPAPKKKRVPPAELREIIEKWDSFVSEIPEGMDFFPANEYLKEAKAVAGEAKDTVFLVFPQRRVTFMKSRAEKIDAVILPRITEVFGISPRIVYTGDADYKKEPEAEIGFFEEVSSMLDYDELKHIKG
ncbi:hypothetical protein AGMMS49975_03070 [Clostridia bacterium]|nr:hypothetical protein AGMMS49975_03070 [Clostridia bacterium]